MRILESGKTGERTLIIISLMFFMVMIMGACSKNAGGGEFSTAVNSSTANSGADFAGAQDTAEAGHKGTADASAADPAAARSSAAPEQHTEATTPAAEKTAQRFILPEGTTILTRFAVPEGYVRTAEPEGSLGNFVRNYPLKPDGSPVVLWDKTLKWNQSDHAAVFAMKVEDEIDVQQCADSVMRMYAEYFRASGQYDRIRFHFVGGFLCDYNTYIQGNRVKFNGDNPHWARTKQPKDTDEVFNEYIKIVSAYSSTLSMEDESEKTDLRSLQIGDVFLKGGSPGHVVMVADICERDGKKAFLLAQGYMPAQDFHIIKNPRHSDDPWYYEDEVTYPFRTQAYTFPEGSLRHMKY